MNETNIKRLNIKEYSGYSNLNDNTKTLIKDNEEKGLYANRLIFEKSPYLLQHAFNPVNWYPWGDEAFKLAIKENKPIFLSIGYSTCYWCHVMEREIFENEVFAKLLNEYFICIKVDREERPDIDRIYMSALVKMTGSGGWPMSLFLTPDLKPFYGATYIPPVEKYGQPAFPDLVTSIYKVWKMDPEKVKTVGDGLIRELKKSYMQKGKKPDIKNEILDEAFNIFASVYDPKNGGFDRGPKFPQPTTLNFLLRFHKSTGNVKALEMTLNSLKKMYAGGVYDHMGGGFHRYSVDGEWRVPHFEKMLYDEAQIAITYIYAFKITKDEFYINVAKGILDYILRELTSPNGGFYSAQDAESSIDESNLKNKEEGAFYTWTKDEIESVLKDEEALIFNFHYGVKKEGNATHDPQGIFKGKNILYLAHTIFDTAKEFEKNEKDVIDILNKAKEKLFKIREQRIKPHKDDKVLLSWNGLTISAMSLMYQVTGDVKYLNAAKNSAEFLNKTLYFKDEKKLLRRFRAGEARFLANLSDYAFFVYGLIDLYESSLNIEWLDLALELTKLQILKFYDSKNGGFYETEGKDKSILIRIKDTYDGAIPTGNSIALMNLLKLSQITDNEGWREMAEKSLSYFSADINERPYSMPMFLSVIDFNSKKQKQIIIAGVFDREDTKKLFFEVYSHFMPNKVILFADGSEGQKRLASFIPFLKSTNMIKGRATAYVCEDFKCDLPVFEIEALRKILLK